MWPSMTLMPMATCVHASMQQKYDALFDKWSGQSWINELNAVHGNFEATLDQLHGGSCHDQPNPWDEKTTSKRYLIKLLDAYGDIETKPSVAASIFKACTAIAEQLNGVQLPSSPCACVPGSERA